MQPLSAGRWRAAPAVIIINPARCPPGKVYTHGPGLHVPYTASALFIKAYTLQ